MPSRDSREIKDAIISATLAFKDFSAAFFRVLSLLDRIDHGQMNGGNSKTNHHDLEDK